MDAKAIYEEWLTSDLIDEDTKQELRRISGDEKEIEERFYEDLKFGTGGLRGAMGAGTNRMNRYTVRKATQGLANHLLKEGLISDGRKCARVAISFDNRYNSKEFALETAAVLVANGIEVHMFPNLHPTPMLSFAVRYLSCDAGVNITASHNPKEDNGYKVYGADGSQVVPPQDKAIMQEVAEIGSLNDCKSLALPELLTNSLFHVIGQDVDDAFIKDVLSVRLQPEECVKAKDCPIVYSPLHGTGLIPVNRVLSESGFKCVYTVPGQAIQDGGFPTVKKPNPENPEAFTLAEKLAKEVKAELIILTDPDADRTGIRVLDRETGEYVHFTGNMMGALLTEYVLSNKSRLGKMPENPALVSTVVISDMVRDICKDYGVFCEASGLIGFKNIAMKIREYEQEGTYNYVFGLEDSDGCLPGTYARDKDSVGTAMLLAEAAAFAHNKGLTLWDEMKRLYEKYGYYGESLKSLKLAGIEGKKRIDEIIANLRSNPLNEFAGHKCLSVTDYKLNKYTDILTGEEREAGVHSSNMLYYRLDRDAWFLVRPSGTEPTIKFYAGAKGTCLADRDEAVKTIMDELMKLAER